MTDRHSFGGTGTNRGELHHVLEQRRRLVEGHEYSPLPQYISSSSSRSGASSAPTASRIPHRLSAPGGSSVSAVVSSVNNTFRTHPARPPLVADAYRSAVPANSHGGVQRDMERRMSDMLAKNKSLQQQVDELSQRLARDEGATFSEERNLLLAETDTLLAETDRMAQQSQELAERQEEFKAEAAKFRACSDLQNEVAELRAANLEQSRVHSELTVELAAAVSRQPGPENSERQRALAAESDDMRRRINDLSLEVVNLQAKLQQKTQQLEEAEASRLVAVQSLEIERVKAAEACQLLEIERVKAAEAVEQLGQMNREASNAKASASSESRLRIAMTQTNSSSAELRSAVKAVEALLEEANRELSRKVHRERRAAFEKLCAAIDKEDEVFLESALLEAQTAGVDESDIKKGEDKLLELQSMSEEQKAARASRELEGQRKKDAFLLVKKDQAAELQAFIEGFEEGVRWMDWRDYAGRTLYKAAQELHAESVKALLARLLGLKDEKPKPPTRRLGGSSFFRSRQVSGELSPDDSSRASFSFGLDMVASDAPETQPEVAERHNLEEVAENAIPTTENVIVDAACKTRPYLMYDNTSGKLNLFYQEKLLSATEEAEMKTKAFRAVVQDDEEKLSDILESVPIVMWEKWKNKADKDLLTLSQERGSSLAYSVIAKALGILKEQARDVYEYGEAVWVFMNGDVQARRATVKEDTPAEADMILVEYWDGDEPAMYVERPQVRKSG